MHTGHPDDRSWLQAGKRDGLIICKDQSFDTLPDKLNFRRLYGILAPGIIQEKDKKKDQERANPVIDRLHSNCILKRLGSIPLAKFIFV